MCALQCPGRCAHPEPYRTNVRLVLSACLMRSLMLYWADVHVPGRFGCDLVVLGTMVCGILCGSVVFLNASVVHVRSAAVV